MRRERKTDRQGESCLHTFPEIFLFLLEDTAIFIRARARLVFTTLSMLIFTLLLAGDVLNVNLNGNLARSICREIKKKKIKRIQMFLLIQDGIKLYNGNFFIIIKHNYNKLVN